MNIQEQLQHDLKDAMRGRDQERVSVIRMALAALQNAEMVLVKAAFDAAPADAADTTERIVVRLSELAMQETLAKEVKRRHDAAELYEKGGRPELARQELAEAALLETYLPRQLGADELRPQLVAAIKGMGATSMADMGKVMPVLMQQFKGRADGRLISQLTREILGQAQ